MYASLARRSASGNVALKYGVAIKTAPTKVLTSLAITHPDDNEIMYGVTKKGKFVRRNLNSFLPVFNLLST